MLSFNKKLSLRSRVNLYRTMATYAKNNRDLYTLFRNKKARAETRPSKDAKVFIEINKRLVNDSMRMSDALAPFIPADEALYIANAQRTDNLYLMLTELVFLIEEKHKLRSKLISVSTKPIFIMLAAAALLGVTFYILVPEIASFALSNDLDEEEFGFTQNLGFSIVTTINPVMKYLFPFASTIFLSVFAISVIMLPLQKRSSLRSSFDYYLPHYRLYKEYTGAVILLGLGSTMRAGAAIDTFFRYLKETSDPYTKSWAVLIYQRVTSGDYAIGEALNVNIFSRDDMDQIEDYMDSGGDPSENLSLVGHEAAGKAIERMERISKISFAVIISITLLFAFIYIGSAISLAVSGIETDY